MNNKNKTKILAVAVAMVVVLLAIILLSNSQTVFTGNVITIDKTIVGSLDKTDSDNWVADFGAKESGKVNIIQEDALVFTGKDKAISTSSSDFGKESFSISTWVEIKGDEGDTGSIAQKFDAKTKTGFNFDIMGTGGNQLLRNQIYFGINNGISDDAWTKMADNTGAVKISGIVPYKGMLVGLSSQPPKVLIWNDSLNEWGEQIAIPDTTAATLSSNLFVFGDDIYFRTANTVPYRFWKWNPQDGVIGLSGRPGCDDDKCWFSGTVFPYDGEILGVITHNPVNETTGQYLYVKEYLSKFNGTDWNWLDEGMTSIQGVVPTLRELFLSAAVSKGEMYLGSDLGGRLFKVVKIGSEPELVEVKNGADMATDIGNQQDIQTMSVYNGELYAGTRGAYLSYGPNVYDKGSALLKYDQVNNKWIDTTGPYLDSNITGVTSSFVYNGMLYAILTSKDGTSDNNMVLMEFDGDAWTEVARGFDSQKAAKTVSFYKNNLYVGTNPNSKVATWKSGISVTYDEALTAGWHQITVVKDNAVSKIKLYVDGSLVSESEEFNVSKYDLTNAADLTIGKGAIGDFKGTIDEFTTHGRALSSEEVSALYNGGRETVKAVYYTSATENFVYSIMGANVSGEMVVDENSFVETQYTGSSGGSSGSSKKKVVETTPVETTPKEVSEDNSFVGKVNDKVNIVAINGNSTLEIQGISDTAVAFMLDGKEYLVLKNESTVIEMDNETLEVFVQDAEGTEAKLQFKISKKSSTSTVEEDADKESSVIEETLDDEKKNVFAKLFDWFKNLFR